VGKVLVGNPGNAIYGAGVHRLLNHSFWVAILGNNPRPTVGILKEEGMARYVGTMAAANAHSFIDIDGVLPQNAAQFRLIARAFH
jgi:hypothetical protein